ncbi:MAG: DNA photolyase family protein [Acidobacteriia bacterium]|nr:deoxyribodipyrimidine photo-lyase [Methyloceanibacter sp.]MCL6490716.1 DNA photolyase family protein [Terriglobia bacterium]
METPPAIVWFRNDLRISDNPALRAASALGQPIVPVYILDEHAPGTWAAGGAARWWLHHSLAALKSSFAKSGLDLLLLRGPAALVLPRLVRETGARAVFWNRLYEPWAVQRDRQIKSALRAEGVKVASFNASLLFEPTSIRTRNGEAFRVFTPFWRACLAAPEPSEPEGAPDLSFLRGFKLPAGERLEDWRLLPTAPNWAGGLQAAWQPGEAGARARLDAFLAKALDHYESERDRPDHAGTSRLSPHLHWGEISPRQVWHAAKTHPNAKAFLRQLGWREFSYHLLFAFPSLPEEPLDARFQAFPWAEDAKALASWQRGRTGYPIVDAGMRELWQTGWMHNRARMVCASFLVKHLLLPWQYGERWFWDTLVDADLANNAAGWQWVAGCGADAAPYFRIFNPVLQGEKFDPNGDYVRKFVPELARLPARFIHRPWEAPPAVLDAAGVKLGTTYPAPIVDHRAARERALASFVGERRVGIGRMRSAVVRG